MRMADGISVLSLVLVMLVLPAGLAAQGARGGQAGTPSPAASRELPEAKRTSPGLYVTAREASELALSAFVRVVTHPRLVDQANEKTSGKSNATTAAQAARTYR
jgi:hypothetical protein